MSALDGFILVMNGGQVLVGKLTMVETAPLEVRGERGEVVGHTVNGAMMPALSPVYELHMSAKVDDKGRSMGVVRVLVPVMMSDVPYVNLPESYAWLPLSSLSGPMQRELERGAAKAEEMREKIRMGEIGLVKP